MKDLEKWDRTEAFLKEKISGFEVVEKESKWFHRLLGKIIPAYAKMWTTIYPRVLKPKEKPKSFNTLQHEGVHLFDKQTLFGLMPLKLKWLNVVLFYVGYFAPQIFAIFAIFAIWNPWWLLCLLLLAPIPAPVRKYAEERAYRRSRELGRPVEDIIYNFTTKKYYFMWPFRKSVVKSLKKDSPYKEEMDKIFE